MIVKCAICGSEIEVDEREQAHDNFVSPNDDVALRYYNLWHFDVTRCRECNYASKDISICANKNFVYSPKLKQIITNKAINDLNEIHSNSVADYFIAGEYYASIDECLDSALCFLQAGDYMFKAIFDCDYFEFEDDDFDYTEYENLANILYSQGESMLKDYLTKVYDIRYVILLIGVLLGMGKKDEAIRISNEINKSQLNTEDLDMLQFVMR